MAVCADCKRFAEGRKAIECFMATSVDCLSGLLQVATLGLCRFGQVPDGYGGCKAPDVAPSLSFYMYKAGFQSPCERPDEPGSPLLKTVIT